MIVMGIDPGSRVTGYGVIASGKGGLDVLAFGVVRPRASGSFPERVGQIFSGLEDIVARTRPDCIAVETAFVGRNVRSALALGQVRGAVLALAARAGIPVREYAPSEVKLAVAGTGSARKEQVAFMLERLLGIGSIEAPADASDALGIAYCDLSRSSGCAASPEKRPGRQGGKKSNPGWAAFLADHPDRIC